MMGECRDCRHWVPDDGGETGACGFFGVHYFDSGDEAKRRYGLHYRHVPGFEQPEDDLLPKNLITDAEFGCVKFEAKP